MSYLLVPMWDVEEADGCSGFGGQRQGQADIPERHAGKVGEALLPFSL